jgi:ribosomal-protein-alanine N-acetyltransferase
MTVLQTRRLTLSPAVAEDTRAFEDFYGDPAVMSIRKFGVLDKPTANSRLRAIAHHWEIEGFGMWVVRDRVNGEFAGECGLRWLEDRTDVELSYGLFPRFRGQGLATEAARAALDYGVCKLGLRRVVALSRSDKVPSHRVLAKLGMVMEWEKAGKPFGLMKFALHPERSDIGKVESRRSPGSDPSNC